MNIQNIEKKEKNMATFEVKVPADVFDNAVNEVYKKNKSQLYVAGFRKGKAPRAVIEGMYGKDVFYPEAIETLAQAILELKHSDLSTTIIGTRHGEKLFEVLVTAEEMMRAEDLPGFFRIPADNRDLNYDNYFSKGNPEFGKIEQYTSHNTHRLNVEEMKQLLLKLKLFGGNC